MTDDHNPFTVWERNFREQVLRARQSKGMTQTDLARGVANFGLKFHQQTVQRIENGERPVRLNEAHIIAKVLDLELESMTSAAARRSSDMRYAVERLQRSAESELNNIHSSANDWTRAAGDLTGELIGRKLSNLDEWPDDVSLWGMAWAAKALEVQVHLQNAIESLAAICEIEVSDETRFIDAVWIDVATWRDQLPEVQRQAAQDATELHRSFPADRPEGDDYVEY